MKTNYSILLGFIISLTLSCQNANPDNPRTDREDRNESGLSSFFSDDKQTYDFKDPKSGLTVYSVEYPSSWKILTKPTYESDRDFPFFLYQIQGPDGIKAFNTPLKTFISYSNPQMAQYAKMDGQQNLRPLLPIETLVQQDIEPAMRKQGFTYEGIKRLPELERMYQQKVTENAQVPVQAELHPTVWVNATGQKVLVTIGRINYRQQMPSYGTIDAWYYAVDYVISEAENFDEVIEEFSNAQLGIKENPQWKSHSNQIIAQRTEIARRQSAINHQNNMAQQQASFNAHQQRMKTLNSAQDASHASFMNRTFGAGSSTSQTSAVNTIWEEETVSHPNGNSYQVEAGAKEYWMDGDGNYIKSDDLFYNPNGDMNINNIEWTKVREDY